MANLDRSGNNSKIGGGSGEPGRPAGMGIPAAALGGGPPLARHPQEGLGQRGALDFMFMLGCKYRVKKLVNT